MRAHNSSQQIRPRRARIASDEVQCCTACPNFLSGEPVFDLEGLWVLS